MVLKVFMLKQEMMNNNEPRPLGEVIKDLIQGGEILPNYKSQDYDKEDR